MPEDRRPGDPALGRELRQIREQAGLSQLALAARLGLTGAQISRIETGTRSTGVEMLQRWYRECGYELDAVHVGTPQQATSLALAAAALPADQIDAVIGIIRAWPRLPDVIQGRILGLIDPFTEQK